MAMRRPPSSGPARRSSDENSNPSKKQTQALVEELQREFGETIIGDLTMAKINAAMARAAAHQQNPGPGSRYAATPSNGQRATATAHHHRPDNRRKHGVGSGAAALHHAGGGGEDDDDADADDHHPAADDGNGENGSSSAAPAVGTGVAGDVDDGPMVGRPDSLYRNTPGGALCFRRPSSTTSRLQRPGAPAQRYAHVASHNEPDAALDDDLPSMSASVAFESDAADVLQVRHRLWRSRTACSKHKQAERESVCV